MTLFTRLLISHWGPIAILTLALAFVLSALFRISVVLTTLSQSELDSLQDEGRLHRTAWELDVEMRHGQLACAHGESAQRIHPALERRVSALAAAHRALGSDTPLSATLDGYIKLGTRALTGDTCRNLLAEGIQTQRAELDEQLTNFWVARLDELHRAVRRGGQGRETDRRDGDLGRSSAGARGVYRGGVGGTSHGARGERPARTFLTSGGAGWPR